MVTEYAKRDLNFVNRTFTIITAITQEATRVNNPVVSSAPASNSTMPAVLTMVAPSTPRMVGYSEAR